MKNDVKKCVGTPSNKLIHIVTLRHNSSLFSIKHFQAKIKGNIVCFSFGFRDKTLQDI